MTNEWGLELVRNFEVINRQTLGQSSYMSGAWFVDPVTLTNPYAELPKQGRVL